METTITQDINRSKSLSDFIQKVELTNFQPLFSEQKRTNSFNLLSQLQFPTTKDETWKYTRLAKISGGNYQLQDGTKESIIPELIENLEGTILVFVNGKYAIELSKIQPEVGVSISPIHRVDKAWLEANTSIGKNQEELFLLLNDYFAQDGVAIEIEKNTQSTQTVQVLNYITENNSLVATRNAIVIKEGASIELVMSYYAENETNSFSSHITEITIENNANLIMHKIQNEYSSNFTIASEEINQGKDSNVTLHTYTLNGGLVRNNVYANVNGQNSETNLYGIYLLNEKQHVDNHTTIDHQVAHCLSNELYKGVLSDQSTGVFNGKVFVRKDAQKINAFQSNANVLLSDLASMNSKPELEIYADDVKCSHGSTTGQIDEEAIFYLRARGISEKNAKLLMIDAFIGEVIEKNTNGLVKDKIYSLLQHKQEQL
ncbi:MAG: Fe-S cluster assembly protein SufD [Crocinitomicaceae bacterium]|nr:Fe-S cluster assembly protein SufD [Crocinitomicaceae bacterium]